jgi:hypothetical protein
MDFEDFEKNVIFEYWKTLIIKDISNIATNKFLKKPYLEKYIIKLSQYTSNNQLLDNIINLINDEEINNEEIILFLNNNFEWSTSEKKYNEQYFLENDIEETIFFKIAIEILIYQVKYFRFYLMIIELLFDYDTENNELYYFIFLFIKNNKKDINFYSNKNFKFKIFNFYIQSIFDSYKSLFKLLYENKFIENEYNDIDIYNFFLKNIFTNWYNIYKKDIIDNKVSDKIKKYQLKKNILSKILCLPNV